MKSLLLYCTKGDKNTCLEYADNPDKNEEGKWCITSGYPYANGKIVAECEYEVEKFNFISEQLYKDDVKKYNAEIRKHNEICKKSCLSATEIVFYLDTKALGTKNPNGMIGYAIHIKNLHIFDKPKDLDDVKSPKMYEQFKKDLKKAYEDDQKILDDIYLDRAPDGAVPNNVELLKYIEYEFYGLKKAPQNMMYVYDGDEKKVLISIRPEWMCKICNGEKDIELRKVVLKEMLPDD